MRYGNVLIFIPVRDPDLNISALNSQTQDGQSGVFLGVPGVSTASGLTSTLDTIGIDRRAQNFPNPVSTVVQYYMTIKTTYPERRQIGRSAGRTFGLSIRQP